MLLLSILARRLSRFDHASLLFGKQWLLTSHQLYITQNMLWLTSCRSRKKHEVCVGFALGFLKFSVFLRHSLTVFCRYISYLQKLVLYN